MKKSEEEIIYESYIDSKLIELSREDIKNTLGDKAAQYADSAFKYKNYFLILYLEVEDDRSKYHYDVYDIGKNKVDFVDLHKGEDIEVNNILNNFKINVDKI